MPLHAQASKQKQTYQATLEKLTKQLAEVGVGVVDIVGLCSFEYPCACISVGVCVWEE